MATLHHKPCLGCGKVMEGFPSVIAARKYCNRACATRAKTGIRREPKNPPPTKECLNCGREFSAEKPSALKKRSFCSRSCDQAYKVGEKNPNWRGGLKHMACERCDNVVSMHPAIAKTFRYCSKECRAAAERMVRGDSHWKWKGGRKAAMARHLDKKRSLARKAEIKPRDIRRRQVCLPLGPALRYCEKCGLPGVKKDRRYHPECSPTSPKGTRAIFRCLTCGAERKMWPSTVGQQKRCRACAFKMRKGSGNANWKGGITPVNQKIRHSERYKAWRLAVFKRDDYTCVQCGRKGGTLHAHHLKPFSRYPKLRFKVSNGQTLCVPCHRRTDSFLSKAKKRRPNYVQQTMF